ncbi:hypothetical protein PFISCL1PPCAC_12588, partial [Pristionchus fissidentatus]
SYSHRMLPEKSPSAAKNDPKEAPKKQVRISASRKKVRDEDEEEKDAKVETPPTSPGPKPDRNEQDDRENYSETFINADDPCDAPEPLREKDLMEALKDFKMEEPSPSPERPRKDRNAEFMEAKMEEPCSPERP